MQDYLAEAKGTLARTAQKKQTVISQHYALKQRAAKEKKYGFAERPSDPTLVNNVNTAEYFYREISAEIANRVARLNNLDDGAIEREGELFVRNINSEVNTRRRERNSWAYRLKALGSSLVTPEKVIKDKFFGVAKKLPEARVGVVLSDQSLVGKRPLRDEFDEDNELDDVSSSSNDDIDDDIVDDDDDDIYTNSTLRVSFDINNSDDEDQLRASEVEAEMQFKNELMNTVENSGYSNSSRNLDKDEISIMVTALSAYNRLCMSYTKSLPEETVFQRDFLQRKKRLLKEKLKSNK